ncbi:MAG: site-specific integrase [Candidatus Tectomicrobia bacterium]|nr:site-specific integrase [Candidatus Tectomicrobia bacterium]
MNAKFPFFAITDHRCEIYDNEYPGIPIFFGRTGVITGLSDYMIWLVYRKATSLGTAKTYAYHLLKFLKYIGSQGVEWGNVTDSDMIAWRDRLINTEGLSEKTVAAYLGTVFNFYQWAEENKFLRYAVALYGKGDHPNSPAPDHKFQISARRRKTRKGEDFVWPFMPRAVPTRYRHTPTSPELEKLHELAFKRSTGQRDSLLLSFYEDQCLRRSEALSITVDDIPRWAEIDEAIDSDKVFALKIVGKGSKVRHVNVLPDLMRRAREYIEGDRANSVRKATRRSCGYWPPKDLFLGATTGRPLSKEYVSRHVTGLMRSADIENASGHRIRATGLTALAMAYDGEDDQGRPFAPEHVLFKVADHAGHQHWESLRPYLNLARSSVHRRRVDEDIQRIDRLRRLQRENAELKARVGKLEARTFAPIARRKRSKPR